MMREYHGANVTRPVLQPDQGRQIFFTHDELVRIDDALCQSVYVDGMEGELRPDISPERAKFIFHIIDKINRHI